MLQHFLDNFIFKINVKTGQDYHNFCISSAFDTKWVWKLFYDFLKPPSDGCQGWWLLYSWHTGLQQSVCRYKYKYKQWPELSLSASDIPLGESVPQLPSLFPTAHYHFTYRHQTSCYGEHKAKYLRVWDQRMSKCFQPRSCCCRDHWPLAVAWCRVNKQSWPRQISRTELWTVPRSQLFTQPRPDLISPEMDWKCHLMYCIPTTSVCVKPGRYNPVCGATRRNAMHQPSAGWKEYLCTEQRPRPWPGLAGGAGTRVRTSEGFTGCTALGRGRVSPCLRVRCIHTTRPSPASGGGEI